jgi:hypothetical protein
MNEYHELEYDFISINSPWTIQQQYNKYSNGYTIIFSEAK